MKRHKTKKWIWRVNVSIQRRGHAVEIGQKDISMYWQPRKKQCRLNYSFQLPLYWRTAWTLTSTIQISVRASTSVERHSKSRCLAKTEYEIF